MNVLRRKPGWQGDEGFSLAMVLFVTMIGVAVGVALATSVVFTNNQVSLGRETVQARAAAETGIDTALAAFEQSSGTALPCSLNGAASGVATGSTQPTYTVALDYQDAAGAPLTCNSGAVSGTPALVKITSTGKSYAAFGGAPQNQRQMEAAVQLRAGTASWADNFNKAIFSMRNITTTNRWTLLGAGADFYTGGNFACNNNSQFDGSVVSQGTANVTNSCRILGDLWARDQITTSTMGISIGGDVKSSRGGMTMGNNPVPIGGDIILAGALNNTNGQQPNVGGVISQNLGQFQDPPQEEFPHITFDPSDFTEWDAAGFTYMGWREYIDSIRTVPPAQSWWTNTPANFCQIANAGWSLNKAMLTPTTKTVVDARATNQCTSGRLEFSNTNQLKLRNDFTIIASSFVTSGNLTISSVDAAGNPSSEPRTLRIIVPWTAGESCETSPTTNMTFSNSTTIGANVETFFYTSGGIQISNSLSLKGQIYGCKITPSNLIQVNFTQVGGPADSDATAATYQADVLYKRDT